VRPQIDSRYCTEQQAQYAGLHFGEIYSDFD